MRVHALALFLALALGPALAPGSEAQEAGRHATRMNVVLWHPYPDPGGDPFGFPALNTSRGAVDWMAGAYGAYWFPTVRFDGVVEESNRPDADARAFLDAYRARVEERLAEGSPVVLFVNGTRGTSGEGALHVRATSFANLSGERLVLRVAVVEDDIRYAGSNGVDRHRFVARAMLPAQPVTWTPVGGATATFGVFYNFTSPPPTGRLGAVAWLQKETEVGRLADGEVLQSATFLFGQRDATVQVAKAVLVEVYTATWCDACVRGDGAIEILLEEYGVRAPPGASPAWRYLRPPTALAAAAALAVGVPLAFLLVRRFP